MKKDNSCWKWALKVSITVSVTARDLVSEVVGEVLSRDVIDRDFLGIRKSL